MTHSQKILITKMLTGHFLRKQRRGKKEWYVLYDEKVNPKDKVNCKTVDGLERMMNPGKSLFKKDKHKNITLNLNTVRQLHGRTTIKRLYKQKVELLNNHTIYKARNNRKKIKKIDNEKVSYLF
jgi:hypothetical protein